MTSKILAFPVPLERHICSYLPTTHLMRFASTCKAAEKIVAEDEKSLRARGVALRVMFGGDAPALRQIQIQRRLDARLWQAYQEGMAEGPALYHGTAWACNAAACLSVFLGYPIDGLYQIFANSRRFSSIMEEYGDAMQYVTKTTHEQISELSRSSLTVEEFRHWAQPLSDMHAIMLKTLGDDRDRRLAALREAHQARVDFANSALDVNKVGLIAVAAPLMLVNILDEHRRPHGEFPWLNRSAILIGATAFGWGIVCLSHDLPVQGTCLTANGGLLLVRGLTSYRYATGVFGAAKGKWNVARLKTAVYANRLRHTTRCEAVSAKLSSLKHKISSKLGEAAGALAALVRRTPDLFAFGEMYY